MEYKPGWEELQISMMPFSKDPEEAITPDLDNRLELGSTREHPAADSLLFH